MQRGSGDGGEGGAEDWFTEGQSIVRGSPNRVTLMKFKGLLRYQKLHVTDYISIYVFAYNVLYADSLYCYLYSNIRYNIQCRITNFLHCDLDSRRPDLDQDLGARRQDRDQDLEARSQDRGQDLDARRQDRGQDLDARRQDCGQDLGARRQDHEARS